MTPADVQAMINQAYERVDAIDWSRWVPDQRDPLLTHRVTEDKPPLTLSKDGSWPDVPRSHHGTPPPTDELQHAV